MRFASKTSTALLLFAACLPAEADVFLRGELRVTAMPDTGRYEVIAEVPRAVTAGGELALPARCSSERHQAYRRDDARIFAWDIACNGNPGAGEVIGLPFRLDALAIIVNDGATSFTRVITDARSVPLTAPVPADRVLPDIAPDYLWQGMLHIWLGWDHLAFVLCLCFIARGGRQLLLLVTAFTVGHSVSMALAFLDVISVSVPPIEAIIALSIAWMARDALVGIPARQGIAGARHFAVVTAFGLVHGLGFASALDELGVVASERVAALAFFNLGVEAGQLVFVAAVMWLLRRLQHTRLSLPVTQAMLCAVGCIGGYWMIERIAGFAVA